MRKKKKIAPHEMIIKNDDVQVPRCEGPLVGVRPHQGH